MATQRAQTLGAHGVTLVSLRSSQSAATSTVQLANHTYHGAATNLVLLEGLLDLLQHGQVTNVNTNALAGRTEGTKGVAHIHIDLTGVSLGRDDKGRAETGLLSDQLIQLLNLGVVTLEDLQERSLSTGGTLDTTEAQVIASALQVTQIHQQILNPQAGTLANGNKLSGLAVGEAQAGQVLVLLGELGQLVDDDGQLGDEDVKTVTEKDQVGVVSAVARGSTPVDDTSGGRGDLAKGVDVSHDIVSAALLFFSGNLELVILDGGVSLHLLDSLVGDWQAEL